MRNSPLEIALLRGERSTVRTCGYDEFTVGDARSMVAPATHFNGYFVWFHAPLSVGCQKNDDVARPLFVALQILLEKYCCFEEKIDFRSLFANKKG